MKTETIVCCVVAILLGMLLAHMLKNICGCKVVEGQHLTIKAPPRGTGDSCLATHYNIQNQGINNIINSIGNDAFNNNNCMLNYLASEEHQCNRWRDSYPPAGPLPPGISELCTGEILSHPVIQSLKDQGDANVLSMLYYFDRDCCCKVDRDENGQAIPLVHQTCYDGAYAQHN